MRVGHGAACRGRDRISGDAPRFSRTRAAGATPLPSGACNAIAACFNTIGPSVVRDIDRSRCCGSVRRTHRRGEHRRCARVPTLHARRLDLPCRGPAVRAVDDRHATGGESCSGGGPTRRHGGNLVHVLAPGPSTAVVASAFAADSFFDMDRNDNVRAELLDEACLSTVPIDRVAEDVGRLGADAACFGKEYASAAMSSGKRFS